MAQQTINIGTTADDRTGDTWRDAMDKCNDNFNELYIPDAAPISGLLWMAGNATATAIAAIDTPVLVAGSWVVGGTSLFTGTTGGRLTYTGTDDVVVMVNAVVDIEPASGTAKGLTTKVYINGAATSSGRKVFADTALAQNAAVLWQATLSTNDYIELYVENNTDTIDVLVSGAVMVVK